MMQFSKHAVAYLDILGFKHFVTESETKDDYLQKLDELITSVIPREVVIKDFPLDLDIKCLSISDSIVITAPVDNNLNSYHALTAVSIKAIQIAHALLNIKFLVRGGLTIGNIYRTDTNILGTGFQEAINLEKNADYPQIVLSESAECVLSELAGQGTRFAIYSKNQFGKVILNSIYPEKLYFSDPSEEINTRFKKYRETISDNLKAEDPKVLAKWMWFAGLYNANVNYFSCITDKSLLIESEFPTLTMNCLNSMENGFFDSFKQEPVILVF